MAIRFHPKPGVILLCDFEGFIAPEMVKKRPVLVISPAITGRSSLTTIVALSTTPPEPPRSYHFLLPPRSLPNISPFHGKETWVKGDMIYAVSFERLQLINMGKNKDRKRIYFTDRLSRATMADVYRCVLAGIGLSSLGEHL